MATLDGSSTDGPAPIAQLAATAVKARLDAQLPMLIVDVREAWEVALGQLPGAVHLPLAQLLADPTQVRVPTSAWVVLYCHHGMRSQRAAEALQAAGVHPVANLVGGIDAWATDVDASVGRY